MQVIWTRPFTLAVAATFAVFVGFYVLIPALPPYAASLGASKTAIGIVIGIYSIAAVTIRLATGHFIDRHGRKRFLVAGLAIFAAAATGYRFATSLAALIALRVVHGFGWAWITTGFTSLVADITPPSRRGEAIGYWGTAPTIAMAIAPLLGSIVIGGAAPTDVFLLSGALALVAIALLVPVDDPPQRHRAPAPRVSILGSSVLLTLTVFFSTLSYGALVAFLPVELRGQPKQTGMFFLMYAATILLSRPAIGRYSDRHGRAAILHPGLIVTTAGVIALGYARYPLALVAGAILYGLGMSAVFLGLMTLSIDQSGAASRSAAMAGFFAAYDLSIATGAAALGPVYERFGFVAMSAVAAAMTVLAHALFWLDRRRT